MKVNIYGVGGWVSCSRSRRMGGDKWDRYLGQAGILRFGKVSARFALIFSISLHLIIPS